MMELYDIVQSASALVKDPDMTLVINRSIKAHSKFKIYKIFEYKLYIVNVRTDDRRLLLEKSFTLNISEDDMMQVWHQCDKDFLPLLIEWFVKDFKTWI